MEQKSFAPEELILVDTHELVDHERWVPGVYLEQVDAQRHLVEIMENGKRVTRAYKTMCIKHTNEAYDLAIHYEVYADSWRGSDVLKFDGYDAEKTAFNEAQDWASQKGGNTDVDIIVDRVVVGGSHVARFEPKK